jgi:hypothetical protein
VTTTKFGKHGMGRNTVREILWRMCLFSLMAPAADRHGHTHTDTGTDTDTNTATNYIYNKYKYKYKIQK